MSDCIVRWVTAPASDVTFLMTRYTKKHLNVDETAISEYFPADATVRGLFDIYEKFLGIELVRHSHLGDTFWHESVELLEVHTAPRNAEGADPLETLIGYIAIDLFPRAGKYGHACAHGVVKGVLRDASLADGVAKKYSPPVSVVLANFPKATADKPALLLFGDVVTLFHELGHAFHNLFGRTAMPTLGGTNVLRDFVELPSQMLENWCWQQSTLESLARHYKTGEPMPAQLLQGKIAAKNVFSGRDNLRQMQFASYSLELFSPTFAAQLAADTTDTTRFFNALRPRVLPGLDYDESGHFECAFEHLLGYGASYFGYMWSQVFSADVFDYIQQRNGLLDPLMGRRYIAHIIGPGGSAQPAELLRRFLGREPRNDAFVKELGI